MIELNNRVDAALDFLMRKPVRYLNCGEIVRVNRRDLVAGAGAGVIVQGLGSLAHGDPARSSWVPGEAEIDALGAAMRRYDVAGAQIAVIDDGAVAWRRSFGVLNVETGEKVTDETLFQGGSLSKPLFSYVVMKLLEENRLQLDDQLADFYQPHDYVDSAWNRSITVKHVLTHKTGLPNWRSREEPNSIQPAFQPGTQFSYSGEAFYWLQEVCETITGLSLHQLVDQYVFQPGEFTDMSMFWLPENDHREVYGHVVSESGSTVVSDTQFTREHGRHLQQIAARWGRPMTEWRSPDLRAAHAVMKTHDNPMLADRPLWRWSQPGSAIINSAYSLRTSASDYAGFLCAMLPQRKKAAWHIDDQSVAAMLTPHTERTGRHQTRPIGMGWALERWEGDLYFGHTGISGRRHICIAFGDPKRSRGLVIMTNSETGGDFIINMAILLTGTKFRTFN